MRNVFITGVSGSLGSELAAHFLANGDQVAGLDLVEPTSKTLSNDQFMFEKCDLREPEAIQAAVSRIVAKQGVMDVAINNAGLIYNSPLLRFEDGRLKKHDFKQWREVIDVTLSATFYASACCAEAMVSRSRSGVIVNIGSVCAAGNLGQPAYSAAKAGINGLTAASAKELGPLGVRVVAVAPGYIETTSTLESLSPAFLDGIRKQTPTRKLGSVEHFLHAIDFVIANSYFDGKVLEIDGGLTL